MSLHYRHKYCQAFSMDKNPSRPLIRLRLHFTSRQKSRIHGASCRKSLTSSLRCPAYLTWHRRGRCLERTWEKKLPTLTTLIRWKGCPVVVQTHRPPGQRTWYAFTSDFTAAAFRIYGRFGDSSKRSIVFTCFTWNEGKLNLSRDRNHNSKDSFQSEGLSFSYWALLLGSYCDRESIRRI